LVVAFGAGMAVVLTAVGLLAWNVKSAVLGMDRRGRWERWLGLAYGSTLAAIGSTLFLQF
jgi:hypothetical protein